MPNKLIWNKELRKWMKPEDIAEIFNYRQLTDEERRSLDKFTWSELLLNEGEIQHLKDQTYDFKQEYLGIPNFMSGSE